MLPAVRVALGLSLCSLGGIMLYMYFKTKDDEEEETTVPPPAQTGGKRKRVIALQFTISNEIVPVVVGRNGANIKMIEEQTSTVIRFREKNDDYHICEVRGENESVERAKAMIMKEMETFPNVNEEIFVPQTACGKIIGRCGESLQEICRISHAKVSVDSGDRSTDDSTRRVVITGNRTQVNVAKKLIQDKIDEDLALRKSSEENKEKREPRRSPTVSVSSNHSSLTSLGPILPPGETLEMVDTKNDLEIYVSAIASPAKFWIQMIGPQTARLDELVEKMTDYYNKPENQAQHKIADPYLGQIVAALFKYDGKWYRAEIVGILPNEYNPRDVVLDLYFVDYGDSEYIAPHEVFQLRTDFLSLNFQAIESFLAEVKPAFSDDTWEQQAIARFEELTHVASWKKLSAKIITYKDRPKGGNQKKRTGAPIPGLRIYDTSDGNKVSIGHALIAEGYAALNSADTDQANVLRLGGGSSRGSSQSIPSVKSSSENGTQDTKKTQDTNMNPEDEAMPGNGNTAATASNGAIKKSSLNQKKTINMNDMKSNTEDLLNAEKLNGNIKDDQRNNYLDNNKENQLLQS